MACIFPNDNNIEILLIDHEFSDNFSKRDKCEVIFRRINTFLINKKIIKNNIIDLGAWIGDNSIPWSKNIKGIVYAIDPSPNNCDFINKTCKLNNIENVKVIETGISEETQLLSTHGDLTHCSFVYGNTENNGRIRVNSVSLDYLFELNQIDNIGYIHLDVEGMEFRVILGSSNIIDKFKPIITFEQHLNHDNYRELSKHLTDKDYVVFLIDETLPGCWVDCRNFIAFPNEIFTEQLVKDIHNHIELDVLVPIDQVS